MLRRLLVHTTLLALLALGVAACDSAPSSSPASKHDRDDGAATTTSDAEADAADLRIEPGTAIAGIEVGDDEDEAIKALGEPSSRTDAPNEISGATDARLVWAKRGVAATVAPQPGDARRFEVTSIEATDASIRTTEDIGVGSTREELLDAYPDVDCDDEIGGPVVLCRAGDGGPGDVVTDWFVRDGRVDRVVVGQIID